MRIHSSVTSISWIPSEAIQGVTKVPFEMGVAHYDDPPPDHIDSLDALRDADRFRFANELTGMDRGRGRPHHRARPGGWRAHRLDHVANRQPRHDVRGGSVPRPPPGADRR